MLPEVSCHQVSTRCVYGAGQLAELGEQLDRLPARRYLLVTDGVLAKLGFVDRVKAGMEGSSCEVTAVYDDVLPNSETALVEEAARVGRDAGCDGVIGVGGGSAMDTAKAVAILLTGELPLLEYQGAQILDQLLTRPLVTHVAIPTTAGTGSEVTNVSVVLDEASTTKITFLDDMLFPDLALLDPELTTDLPPRVTASTGMDALTHSIEAYVDVQHAPFSDALALEATRLVHTYLLRAVKNGPGDPEARSGMLMAANLAGIAFTHSMVGVVHGVSHALGALRHVPHGEANSVILPHGMRFNLEEVPERFAGLAPALGVDPALGQEEAARAAVEAVDALQAGLAEACGLPTKLSQFDIPADAFPEVVEKAMEDGSMLYNPRFVDEEGVLGILKAAH